LSRRSYTDSAALTHKNSREVEKRIQSLLRTGTGINKAAATIGVGTATVQVSN